nr:hypothetical protein [Tanacetum cinerariifolium]
MQRAVEESLKSVHGAPRGPLPPVVIREPDFGKLQPFLKVQGKGKEKVSDEQVARDLLILQIPKKVSPVKQYIFQRRTPASTEPSVHAESPSIYAELGLTDSDSESDEEVPPVVKVRDQDEGKAGPNPGVLTEDFSFGDLFFNDKPSEADNEKTTAETKAELMVSITIQQDTSAIPPMITLVIDLTSKPDSPNAHQPLQATTTKTTTTTTTTTHPPPPQPQQSTTDSMLIKRIGELEQIMENLIQDNKYLKERLDSHGETNSYKAHEDHMMLYESLEKSMNRDHTNEFLKDLDGARKKKKKRRDSPKTPHGPPPHQPPLPPPPADLHMDDDMAPDAQVYSSDDEYIGNAHIPKVNLQQNWWKPLEEDRPATPEPAWFIPSLDMPVPMNKWASALAVDESIIRHNVSKPLPLCGLPEQMVPDQMWIEEECKYDIAAMYGISYWWFQRQRFYIDKHTSEGDRRVVRTHMRILSVVRIEFFSMYGYDYMKKIVLRRADLNEHIITERDFKYLYPSDFEDLYLLNLQGQLNHLSPKDKKILTTAVNLWTRHLVIRQRVKDFQLGIKSYQT